MHGRLVGVTRYVSASPGTVGSGDVYSAPALFISAAASHFVLGVVPVLWDAVCWPLSCFEGA